jgi:molybdenum cofactor cytidylyltransferase
MTDAERLSIAAVVLAAGSSTRMGRNKLLLEIDGEPMVRRAVRAAIEAGLGPVIVVLGHEADRVRAALAGLACSPVVNSEHAQGMRTSLQCGIERAAQDAGAAVVVLADMPFVSAPMIAALVERQRRTGAPLVVSRYGDVDAPPTLYDGSIFPEILALTGDHCGKAVARRHASEAVVVSWPAAALRDVDVAQDYESVRTSPAGG